MTTSLTLCIADHLGYPLGIPGGVEVWVIVGVVLVLFGGRKLPGLARSMGSSITEFKRGLKDGTEDGSVDGTRKIDSDSKDG